MAVGPLRHVSYAQYEPDVCSWTADYRGMSCAEQHFDAIIFGQQMVEACLPPRRREERSMCCSPTTLCPCLASTRATFDVRTFAIEQNGGRENNATGWIGRAR